MANPDLDIARLARLARRTRAMGLVAGLLLCTVGIVWLFTTPGAADALPPTPVTMADRLEPGVVAAANSSPLRYSDGWEVSATGADPREPAQPWAEPAGTLHFTYYGRELALALAEGDYWGYLYVTVDGQPASALSNIAGNVNHAGQAAGYKTLLAPELASAGAPAVQWRRIHRAADAGPHDVAIEVWRSWGQMPLRGLAIDALPAAGRPQWPGVALLALGGWLLVLVRPCPAWSSPLLVELRRDWSTWSVRKRPQHLARAGAGVGFVAAAAGALLPSWWLCIAGMALLGLASLLRPAYWVAALLFGLPFYFGIKLPLLPTRAFELIDMGVGGGLLLLLATMVLRPAPDAAGYRYRSWPFGLLMALTTWALISVAAAEYQALALREWRTVFLAGALFAVILIGVLRYSPHPHRDRRLLITAWLAGATLMAGIACWQYVTDNMLIAAEGVRRVRGLYGSPNNLALYLERTLAVALALALLDRSRWRVAALAAAAFQGIALLLTFSKGAILLALPAMFLTLWVGGLWILRQRGESRRTLWLLAAAAGLVGLLLTPFLATERFQRLVDLRSGTGFLRLQLWRSAAQMALDHPWAGVGPDNFLYVFRNRYLLPVAWQEPNLNHPHNWLLDWWTRLGLLGLALGLGFWISGISRLMAELRQDQGTHDDAALALGLVAASAAALAHGLIDVSYALPDLMLVWVLMFFVLPGAVSRAT